MKYDESYNCYIKKGYPRVKNYLTELTDEMVRNSKQSAIQRLTQIFDSEENPGTENHYFFDEVQKSRGVELIKQLIALPDTNSMVQKESVLSIVKNFYGAGADPNEIHEAKEMHTILVSYLKVAKKRFIDNVCLDINKVLQQSSELFQCLKHHTHPHHPLHPHHPHQHHLSMLLLSGKFQEFIKHGMKHENR